MKNDPRLPNVGAVLVRQYKGNEIKATVLDEGFEYEGTVFKSLSKLAAHVCGQKAVNGFAFFKLGESTVKKPRKAKAPAAEPVAETVVETPEPVAEAAPEPAPEPVTETTEPVVDPAADLLNLD